jgi:cyclophilin family peptidyl-prolyl cis-trans isomerase
MRLIRSLPFARRFPTGFRNLIWATAAGALALGPLELARAAADDELQIEEARPDPNPDAENKPDGERKNSEKKFDRHSPRTPRSGSENSRREPAGRAGPRVELEIVQGDETIGKIVIELDDKKAPLTVRNFLRYVDEKFYDGTIFHRVVNKPPDGIGIIQGGAYTINNEKKEGAHDPINNESRSGLKNVRGAIAMARTSQPNSATSQFFINTIDNPDLDPLGAGIGPDSAGYAVFGKVIEGMDVVDKIKEGPAKLNPQKPEERTSPIKPCVVKTARRATAEDQAKEPKDEKPGQESEKREEAPADQPKPEEERKGGGEDR